MAREKLFLVTYMFMTYTLPVCASVWNEEVILVRGLGWRTCPSLVEGGDEKANPALVIHRKMLGSPNVCAVEEVIGSRKKYYSECMTYLPRKICQKPTFIRYHCCTGFEKAGDGSEGCQGVAPMENLMDTAKHLYLRDFRKHAKKSGASEMLEDGGAFTVFAPENKAYAIAPAKLKEAMSSKVPDSLSLHHVVNGRHYSQDLTNEMELPSHYKDNATIKFNRYSNGILTANCARIILANQPATNGMLHVTEKFIKPLDGKTVMDLLLDDARFGEMVTAFIITQLANDLRGPGPFTIFAVTDQAFTSAPEHVIDRILKNDILLEKFLRYHMLDQTVCSAAILGPTKVATKEGQSVELSCSGMDQLTVNGNPTVEADIVGTNGVIHVIDNLLIPNSAKSVKDVLQELNLTEFLGYAEQAGLGEVLEWKKETNMTLLVPSVEAFANLTSEQRRILQSQPEAVARVFKYHAVPGRVTTRDLVEERPLRTESDDVSASVTISVYHRKEFSVNGAMLVSSDHQAGNGVIHIIDRVLFPPETTAIGKIQEEPSLSTFLQMLELSGISKWLIEIGHHYTVFAPNNDAFEAMPRAFVDNLLDSENAKMLQSFLEYHLLKKPIYTSGVRKTLRYRFKTVAKEWVDMKRESKAGPIKLNVESTIILEDLRCNNGVVHIIDQPLMCPCLKKANNI